VCFVVHFQIYVNSTLLTAAPFVPQVYLAEVALYTDFRLDESYTPSKISVRVGNTFADLREVRRPPAG
jgi:anaphase-promoting complex subunit 10